MSKIVFINRFFYPDISATSQILADLAFGLAEKGENVTVITGPMLYGDSRARLPRQETVRGVQVYRVLSTRFGQAIGLGRLVDYLSFYITCLWRLLVCLERGDTVVVKTDPPLLAIPALLVTRLRGARQLNWLQDIFPEVAMAAGVGLKPAVLNTAVMHTLSAARDWSIRHADQTVVLGDVMRKYLLDRGHNPDQISIIPNWSDICALYPLNHADNKLRSEWALKDRFVIGYSGNMGVAHDFDLILKAAEKLKDRQDIVFLMIGSGQRRQEVESHVRALGLTNVIFKPYQPREELVYSLNAADVHIVSLRPEMEGFIVPSKICGIAAVGRPVLFLGSASGEIASILKRYECGTTVSGSSAQDFVDAIFAYADDPDRLQAAGSNARRLAREMFDQRRAILHWQTLLSAQSMVASPVTR